jgi:hypothetical protein
MPLQVGFKQQQRQQQQVQGLLHHLLAGRQEQRNRPPPQQAQKQLRIHKLAAILLPLPIQQSLAQLL